MNNLVLTVVIAAFSFSGVTAQERNKPIQPNAQNTNPQKDHDFVQKAMEGGLSEIGLGELAQSRGSSPQVREFGMIMVSDHQKANDELRELAQQNGYENLPLTVPSGTQKGYDQLSDKNGTDFDKAFIQQMIKDHEKTVKLFRKQAENGKDEQLRNWATRTLPILEQHLEQAKRLRETIKNNNK